MSSQNYKVTRNYSYTKDIYIIYTKYKEYISRLFLTDDTVDWRLKHIRGFLYYLDTNKIKIKNITSINVYDYMNNLNNIAIRTREHRAVCIRLFLNYLHDNNLIKITGNQIFPEIKCYKESTMPSYYTNEELDKIINSVDIRKPNGKRDLAILLLFLKFGLRPRDVRLLKLDNIYWHENKIKIIQSKTNYVNILPLDNDTRYALLDYLKNERIISPSEYLFINENGEIYNDHFYYNLVNDYLEIANIKIRNRRHGTYIFRHSLAKQLLDNDNGINVIADVLGHSYMEDAKHYTKLNYKELKKISLEVPTCKN